MDDYQTTKSTAKNQPSEILRRRLNRRSLLKAAGITGSALAAHQVLHVTGGPRPAYAASSGPSTSVAPFVLPSISNVETKAILTVGDAAAGNGYRMVGNPDGLGAFADGSTFTVMMNHELASTLGAVRKHGSKGAFVSKWTIDRATMAVLSGQDFSNSQAEIYTWDVASRSYKNGPVTWNRHCSGDLPEVRALQHGNLGTAERIYLNGEEAPDGRAWARIVTGANAGQVWQLPRMGRLAFENVVACPGSKELTLVGMMDDAALNTAPVASSYPSEVYFYVGHKQATGNPVEAAGLTNGRLYGLRALRATGGAIKEESDASGLGGPGSDYVGAARFDLAMLGVDGDVSSMTPLQMEEDSIAKDVLRLQRPEDGAWDPRPGRENDFYFVTTASFTSNSRLWRVRFDDLADPAKGGTIQILLNATRGRMFDNIAIDRIGRLMIQEDTGDGPQVSKIWAYGIDTGELIEVAHHDNAVFLHGVDPAKFITQDEEASGIIDAEDILGEGWFLLNAQVHKANPDAELVEGGQLLAMYVHPSIARRAG